MRQADETRDETTMTTTYQLVQHTTWNVDPDEVERHAQYMAELVSTFAVQL